MILDYLNIVLIDLVKNKINRRCLSDCILNTTSVLTWYNYVKIISANLAYKSHTRYINKYKDLENEHMCCIASMHLQNLICIQE